jgi:heptose-I-phosphate ethanolaminephosphotransferase
MYLLAKQRWNAVVQAGIFDLSDATRRRLALLSLCLLMFIVVDVAYDGRRLAQVAVLILPGLFMLLLKLRQPWMRRLRTTLVTVWFGAFVFDSAMRVFLFNLYQAQPDSSIVLTAIANTTLRETLEYVQMYANLFGVVVLVGLPLGFTLFVLIRHLSHSPVELSQGFSHGRVVKVAIVLVLLFCALAYANKPWRRQHPLLYWPQWAVSLNDLRSSWTTLDANRQANLKQAGMMPLTVTDEDSTVVLVLSESLNRDNMSTHGYQRATMPQLAAIAQTQEGRLINFRHAWSTKAATLPSLDSFFYFDAGSDQTTKSSPAHLLAVARAAGYHITWISNHDDNAIEQKHARLANDVVLLNRMPGRSSDSPDRLAMQPFRDALAQSHGRKLIVLHLMGVHPHYRLRFPESEDVFKGVDDKVRQQMLSAGRSSSIIQRRDEYDAAMRHHDAIITETLTLTQKSTTNLSRAAWVFVSDHGQEVGHVKDYAGHSFSTPGGFRIPAFIWQKQPLAQDHHDLSERVFRLDWMGIEWQQRNHQRDILSADYRFIEPNLGIQISNFKQ